MRRWPLNNITLFAATHSKLRKAADGIDTQVATCMINKWTTKINEKEIYDTRGPLRTKKERKKEGERDKKKDGRSSYHPRKLLQLSTKELRRRRISHWTKLEDKLPSFLHAFDHSISIWSCPAVATLTKAQFLSPFSLPNLLYWARWIWAYLLNSKKRPKADLTIGAVYGKNLCASENNNRTW